MQAWGPVRALSCAGDQSLELADLHCLQGLWGRGLEDGPATVAVLVFSLMFEPGCGWAQVLAVLMHLSLVRICGLGLSGLDTGLHLFGPTRPAHLSQVLTDAQSCAQRLCHPLCLLNPVWLLCR